MVQTAVHLTHKALTGVDIAVIAVYFVVILFRGDFCHRILLCAQGTDVD